MNRSMIIVTFIHWETFTMHSRYTRIGRLKQACFMWRNCKLEFSICECKFVRANVSHSLERVVFLNSLSTIFIWLHLVAISPNFSAEISLKGLVKVPPNWVNWRSCKHRFKNEWTLGLLLNILQYQFVCRFFLSWFLMLNLCIKLRSGTWYYKTKGNI